MNLPMVIKVLFHMLRRYQNLSLTEKKNIFIFICAGLKKKSIWKTKLSLMLSSPQHPPPSKRESKSTASELRYKPFTWKNQSSSEIRKMNSNCNYIESTHNEGDSHTKKCLWQRHKWHQPHPILSPDVVPEVPGKLFGLDRVTVDKCWLWLSRGKHCLSPGVAVGWQQQQLSPLAMG